MPHLPALLPTVRPTALPALLTAGLTAGLGVPLRPGRRVATALVDRVRRWPVDAQQPARRNARLASTALTADRAERDDVAEFLRTLGDLPGAAHG